MSQQTKEFYDFGDFRLDISEKTLRRGGKFISVTPKVFETLFVLIANAGRTIEKDELMREIWQDRFVEESNLTFNIGMLRKALGDNASQPTFIETVPRRGYRFIAEVKRLSGDEIQANGERRARSSNEQTPHERDVKSDNLTLPADDFPVETAVVQTPRSDVLAAIWSRPIIYSITAILIGVFLTAGFFLLRNQPSFYERFGVDRHGSVFLSVEKLTDTGSVHGSNISPDGKFIVYNTIENGKNGIWLRQIATGKTISLLTATDELFNGLGFSRDGEYIYYSHHRKGEHLNLSRISTLGGAPTHILSGMHSGWSFSPDDRQIAFGRIGEQGSQLMIADADGANERKIFSTPKSRYMFAIAWSPDGKSIAYCIGNGRYDGGGMDYGIYEFNLANGTERSLTDLKWNHLENIRWLPDQSGLLVTGREKAELNDQIWRLSLLDGRAEQITDDTSELSFRGASTDFSRILADQTTLKSSVWLVSKNNLSDARPIAKAEFDVAWMPDGKIVFPTRDTIAADLWLTAADGGKQQLTVNDAMERSPAASPDGRFIVYVSTRNGQQNVWRTDADGNNQKALTNGAGETFPTFTPDGQWVVYTANKDKSLWRVSVEGGEPEQLSAARHQRVAISPDGKQVAYFGRINNQPKLIVESFPECAAVSVFDATINEASMMKVVWTKNGKALLYYTNDISLVGNLWQQPISGGSPQKLTNFTSQRIFDFSLSSDENQIALVRGEWNYDAVLLKGFQ